MAFLRALLVLALAVAVANADPTMNEFKVTFGVPFSGVNYYVDLPRTEADAVAQQWTALSDFSDCTNGGKYNGHRYVLGSDNSISLLFDRQGQIAGIQMNVNATSVAGTGYKYNEVPMYITDSIRGSPVYTMTAYFVDPSTICTVGRSYSQMVAQGTSAALYLQNGPTPATLITVPPQRAAAIDQGWTKNKCFVGMGYHNFYQSQKYQDSQCLAFRPAFLLYDAEINGYLRGFGLAALGNAFSINNRYEYPSSGAIKLIVGSDNVAPCLLEKADSPKITTMHVFFAKTSGLDPSCT